MSKRIEVYFILYLGLLMAFFGIDSEVADYIENQERILAQVAKSKLKNLIEIQKQHQNNVNDDINLIFYLQGDFDKDSLDAKLFFKHNKNENDTFSVDLEKDSIGGFYSALVKRERFNSQSDRYGVQITYKAEPFFSVSSREELLLDFGKEELVNEIINNIRSEGSNIEDTLTVGMTIIPDAKIDPVFFIEPLQNPLNSIRGLNGKIELIVGGVATSDDYTLTIDSDRSEYRQASIRKSGNAASIDLGSLRNNGEVTVTGRNLRTGEIKQETIAVLTFKPRFKNKNRHRSEIYFNSPFTFDGTLTNFESLSDLGRYSLRVTGLIDQNVNSHEFEFNDELQEEGRIAFQLYIDGNKINGMSHEIKVKKPPAAEIKYLDRDGRSMTLKVNAYGRGNKIRKLHIQSGADPVGTPDIEDHEQGQTYIQKIKLKESIGPNIVKLKTTVFSNYEPKKQKFEERFHPL